MRLSPISESHRKHFVDHRDSSFSSLLCEEIERGNIIFAVGVQEEDVVDVIKGIYKICTEKERGR